MKPKFFEGCKVKIQNFDRGYQTTKRQKKNMARRKNCPDVYSSRARIFHC